VTGWSRSAQPTFDVYYEEDFLEGAAKLTETERNSVFKTAKDLEAVGPLASDGEIDHPAQGRIRVRFCSGIVALFREKCRGPKTICMLGCGRYSRGESGELVTTMM
jgi:hypothetical protein